MTQPWADWEPILNDYAGYALTTGKIFPFLQISLALTHIPCFSGQILRRSSGPSFRPRQFVVGAPRAGKERTGSVFIVEYNGTETITRVKKLNGHFPQNIILAWNHKKTIILFLFLRCPNWRIFWSCFGLRRRQRRWTRRNSCRFSSIYQWSQVDW